MDYWASKRKKHRNWAIVFGACFVGLLGLAAWVLMMMVNTFVDLSPGQPGQNLAQVAVLALLATPVLWPSRILARGLLSNMHLSTDAGDRETMVNTYLALSELGLTDSQQLDVVLQALFRPSSTGIVAEDGAPSWSPGEWIRNKLT